MTDEEKRKALGKSILKARIRRGFTQHMLSEQVFVSQQAIAQWESGKTWPSLPMLLLVAEALQCDVSDILQDASLTRKQILEEKKKQDTETKKDTSAINNCVTIDTIL